ncbi:ATP-dependent carboxylate-amine ligase domain protein ATP-grasp [Vulcanisaeta moutnovskia 768-28]|uniref:Formate-dependent phosphoribosylglycinamide formyltransferase n=1 Tax=Vulcanisaeta moutnovskia (strain 768-28) TaxID=985053 RepID=F0QVW8_VULM7|nr:formate-dependent phosphoribosylglycinamide formyltransferase [Vulcanisaeta moutnovskia]ADY02142.1 ATP-dependent carboxylate-amine ligase domain protein ATP-grasp [Vulcanisaeta moutnovskia 768-28]
MSFGPPLLEDSRKIMLLGSGELGKEMAIEAQRMGVEVIAVDRYDMAPAIHVAHRRYVVNMMDGNAIKALVRRESPDAIIAEIEAINTDALLDLEEEGFRVMPNARAVKVCMNRVELRRLAAEELQLPTARYFFAEDFEDVKKACMDLGFPCLLKPEMSSSGHGHVLISKYEDVERGFKDALTHARGGGRKVVVEEYVRIDRELTVLTYRYPQGNNAVTATIPPIEHQRPEGIYHYVESWHPSTVSNDIIERAREYAIKLVNKLGGLGIYGVEILITRDGRVLFSEASPRPHDTGLVTLVSTDINEFQIHVRSALGLPTPEVKLVTPAAAHVILAETEAWAPRITGLEETLRIPGVQVRLFGKPFAYRHRRMGIVLATGNTVEEAREKARLAVSLIKVR